MNGRQEQLSLRTKTTPALVSESVVTKLVTEGTGALRPRARLIRTIGAELISSEIVAITELVRNCYDADATRVEIRFTDPHLPEKARFEIVDNGHGMTQEILLGPWLEPATDHKTSNGGAMGGTRSPAGRRRLGSKGVGRFAAQRLGDHLTVSTATEDLDNVLEARFNWIALDRADRYLDELEIPWREVAVAKTWHGTRLEIDGLKDEWTEERFERLRLSLSRMVGPGLGTDTFELFIVINGVPEPIRPSIEHVPAMYSIDGEVSADGSCTLTYRDSSGAEEPWERSVLWPPTAESTAGPFRVSINAWDLDKDALEYYFKSHDLAYGLRDFRRMIREHSGISLYRDGFRILPYGEPDNDWLRLDRRRVNNPTLRLSNNQILGAIHLKADENPRLRDQTNREGLVTNESYTHLQRVTLEILSYLEARRFKARREMYLDLRGGAARSAPEVLAARSPEIQGLLERLETNELGPTRDLVQELRRLLDENREAGATALRQYADLATVGHLSSQVFMQMRHPVAQIQTELGNLRELLEESALDDDEKEDASVSLQKIDRLTARMETTMHRLDPMAVPRRFRQPVTTTIESCIEDIIELFADRMIAAEIDVFPTPNGQREVETDPYVIQGVLALLFENAEYWVSQRKRKREIRIVAHDDGFDFENNGLPIPAEYRKQIFEAYFTTRQNAAGMGLFLARDLLATIGGTIELGRKRKWVDFKIRLAV